MKRATEVGREVENEVVRMMLGRVEFVTTHRPKGSSTPFQEAPLVGIFQGKERDMQGRVDTVMVNRFYKYWPKEDIIFGDKDLSSNAMDQNDPMVIRMEVANYQVHKVLIDNGSSMDIIFTNVLRKMELGELKLKPVQTPLVGFGGSEVVPKGVIDLPVQSEKNLEGKLIWCSF
ncbi:UNVERIFIED_CONTAM: hypothetical protein Sindi_2013500 [Sesamum indicum]